MKLLTIHNYKVRKILADLRLKKLIGTTVKINRMHDVPHVAGYSKDGKTIYVDRHFPLLMGKIDILKYVLLYEKIEKALIQNFKMKPQEARYIATYAEKKAVEEDGINWEKYEKHFLRYDKKISVDGTKKFPVDLDTITYEDDKQFGFLKQTIAKMYKEKFNI